MFILEKLSISSISHFTKFFCLTLIVCFDFNCM